MQRCTRVDVFIYKINFLGGSRCGAAFFLFAGLGCLQRAKGQERFVPPTSGI